jgi:hypothetical protein
MQPVLAWELFRNRTWSVGLDGVDLEPVLALGRRLVEERPRPMHELRAAMAERWPDRDAATLAYAIRNQLPTFQVPPRGVWGRTGQVALTTIDHWSGRPLATGTAPDGTVLRYLAAFGPASTGDVAAWSGLTGLRDAMDRLRPRLRTFRDERGRELFDVPDAPLADPDLPAPVRFLPDYDNLLLSHDDRSRVIPAPIMAEVRKRIGGPSFLVDGFVAGMWRLEGTGTGRRIALEPLVPLAATDRDAVEAEAWALTAFLVPGADSQAPLGSAPRDRAPRARRPA